jgi:hypothetical protein
VSMTPSSTFDKLREIERRLLPQCGNKRLCRLGVTPSISMPGSHMLNPPFASTRPGCSSREGMQGTVDYFRTGAKVALAMFALLHGVGRLGSHRLICLTCRPVHNPHPAMQSGRVVLGEQAIVSKKGDCSDGRRHGGNSPGC